MAYFDKSGELGSLARALRLALIILPVVAVFLSVIRVVQSAELLQTQWGHSLAFLIAHDALYPLLYLAFGLWAAHVIKPINFLNLSVLQWVLIGLAVALLAGNLYYDHKGTGALLSRFTKGGYLFLSSSAAWMANALGFAVICIFAATTLPRFEIESLETVTGRAAVMRRALIIVPIVGLSLAAITTLLFRIDDVRNGFTSNVFIDIHTFITPLAYLAIGLWAANLIKPIKGLDLQSLKWALILIGITLPVLSAYNDLQTFFELDREDSDGGSWLLRQFAENPELVVLLINYWIREVILALICFFVTYEIDGKAALPR